MIEAKPSGAKGSSDPPSPVSGGAVESRLDPITGNWTIFAPHRVQRPEEFVPQRDFVGKPIECPFCPGNESTTPPPVWVGKISEDDSSLNILDPARVNGSEDSWSVRVVPNKYPAVSAGLRESDRFAANSPCFSAVRCPVGMK